MAIGKRRGDGANQNNRMISHPFDEADWVDWDHWQTVEEIQKFMDGLSGERDSTAEPSDDPESAGNVATQIRRHGLQADG
jgi:hypothetical protein